MKYYFITRSKLKKEMSPIGISYTIEEISENILKINPIYVWEVNDYTNWFKLIKKERKFWTIPTMKFLIKQGLNLNKTLEAAVTFSHEKIVKFLIKNGANIHSENTGTLKYALRERNSSMVKLLLKNGADVHIKNNPDIFQYALAMGNLLNIKLLIEYGADLKILSKEQMFLIANALPFNIKYQYNLTKEDLTTSTLTQYLNWAQKNII